ncbi:hypothetical protein Q8F55_003154 [Vanrija albida]|uniref:Phosphogluconate dehydrogenase NAD-binding putative C-terminal domain-containing protein n=1 Tax=Vanrija albida TaxID=181172 RepID=A0ABR3QBP0_9TREE
MTNTLTPTTTPPTIGILYPGAMGAGLARTLHARAPALRLLTAVGARSPETRERAAAAGLEDLPLAQVVAEADILVSILPPASALPLAREVAALLAASGRPKRPIYVELNAVSPATMGDIAAALGPETPLVDGSVIGLPPKEGYDPRVYLSSAPEWGPQLAHVAALLSQGWTVRVLHKGGAGGASALKMCHGGTQKGATGLAALLVLAAHAHSPDTAAALLEQLADTKPDQVWRLGGSLPDMIPKAYRVRCGPVQADTQWVAEMEEISSFVTSSLGLDPADTNTPAAAHLGLARVFERVAAGLRASAGAVGAAAEGEAGNAEEVETLKAWAARGRETLTARGYAP